MSKVSILDCTLRDGGYINNWAFGKENIISIIDNLRQAKINFIEIGYLSQNKHEDVNSSVYSNFNQLPTYLKNKNGNLICMINYGDYNIENIPNQSDTEIDGIRIAFHKKDMEKALNYAKQIKNKGYKVFIQPMITRRYSYEELKKMIEKANKINPFSFYFVDSFGEMLPDNLKIYFDIINKNLNENIVLGFHSHNNLQLSFSNAQVLINQKYDRDIIIDASCLGMGRGAGNLNTELITDYFNSSDLQVYNLKPILNIIDNIVIKLYKEKYWGYSLPYYISGKIGCHPNYATFLYNKQTLSVQSIYEILNAIDSNNSYFYNKEYIEELYLMHMKNNRKSSVEKSTINEISKAISARNILILAPGRSIADYKDIIKENIKRNRSLVICCNFEPEDISYDYIFYSNEKRLKNTNNNNSDKIIISSNLYKYCKNRPFMIKYKELLNKEGEIVDNCTLLFIQFLIKNFDVKEISIAGLDGFSYDNKKNYYIDDMNIINTPELIEKKNSDIKYLIQKFKKKIDINFITPTRFKEF